VKATPLQARQFLEVGSASAEETGLPAFGSVIFSLGSTSENAGINAHISILFTKSPEEAEDGDQQGTLESPQGDSGEKDSVAPPPMPPGGDGVDATAVQPSLEAGSRGKEPMQAPSPPLGPAPPGITEEKWRAMWEGVEEGHGWAYVVEDKSLCEEAEAHLAALRPPSARSQD